jgi:hypothetical protein
MWFLAMSEFTLVKRAVYYVFQKVMLYIIFFYAFFGRLSLGLIVGIHCSWVVMITNQIERGGLPDFMSGMRIINKTINSGEACRTRACMLQYHWSDWCDGF